MAQKSVSREAASSIECPIVKSALLRVPQPSNRKDASNRVRNE